MHITLCTRGLFEVRDFARSLRARAKILQLLMGSHLMTTLKVGMRAVLIGRSDPHVAGLRNVGLSELLAILLRLVLLVVVHCSVAFPGLKYLILD